MPVAGCWLLGVGCWLLVASCWLWVVCCWLLVVGWWLLVAGCLLLVVVACLLVVNCWLMSACCWLLVVGCWLLAAVCLLLAVGCWLLVACCCLLAVCCWFWLLVAGCWLLIAGCWLLAVGCWLLVAGCWLLVACCWLLVVGWWLLVAGCLLLVVVACLLVVGCWLLSACCCLELAVWDHTAAVDMKMFTRCADDLLGAALAVQPGAPVQSVEAAMREVRQRKWRLRFTVAYEEAYSGNADTRRPARNYLQVAHVQEQPLSFAGSPKPLVCIGADNFLPGCPHLQLSDVALDDAGQAQTTGGLRLQCAEFLITDAEPEQTSHELERGVRITFTCVDAFDKSSRARLMWVLSIKESLPVARLPALAWWRINA